jgi:hypothetical protein
MNCCIAEHNNIKKTCIAEHFENRNAPNIIAPSRLEKAPVGGRNGQTDRWMAEGFALPFLI